MRWARAGLALAFLGVSNPGAIAANDANMTEIVDGNHRFALDLYGQLRLEPGNVFVSPYSLATALAMTYAGARGETAAEMARTLHFPPDRGRVHTETHALGEAIKGSAGDEQRPFALSTANALWVRAGEPLLPDFVKLLDQHYHAGLREIDFRTAEKAREIINRWVEAQTKEKIKDLLAAPYPYPNTALILTNAIYFKGRWSEPFTKEETRDADFTVGPGTVSRVAMMQRAGQMAYLDTGTFHAVELPYAGDALSMVLLVPKKDGGLAALERSLDWTALAARFTDFRPRRVNLYLPRFKIEYRVALEKTLAAMGMRLAFSSDADFSGINGQRDLFVSAVLHKAFVEVNEEGTEAAAATAVAFGRSKAAPQPIVTVRADQPFVFLIRDRRTGCILFLGRLVNPRPAG